MADIGVCLQKILDAIYGEEVRGSIHDALKAMNAESSKAMEYASTAKDSAQASAAEAKASVSTAAQKASAASASAQAAKASENNAKISETNTAAIAAEVADAVAAASVSAQAAKASEDNAKISETNTAAIAAEVADALAAAKASETAAANSETIAAQKASDAAASAASAEQYSGKPPKPLNGTWWIWDAGSQEYVDSKISCELAGPVGVGIDDFQFTSGDHTPGTMDIYTLKLTDDTSYSISVYNGRNGTGVGNVLGIWFDLTIPAADWKEGEITIVDERLLALSNHKYFLRADEASRKEFLDCNIQPKDITTTGFITFTSDTAPTEDLTVHLIRLELAANGTI